MAVDTGLYAGFNHAFQADYHRRFRGGQIWRAFTMRRLSFYNYNQAITGQLWPRY